MQRLAMGHITRGLKVLKDRGTVRDLLGEMQTRAELYDLLDYQPGQPWIYPTGRASRP
jgi:methylisocitrate lyase